MPGEGFCDLTGKWTCDDGGTYYLKQLQNQIVWYGELSATDPNWSNVFYGRVNGDRIVGNWFDVPKGKASNHGQLKLRIGNNGRVLDAFQKSGGFGGSHWTKTQTTGIVIPPPPQSPCTLVVTATGQRADVAPMFTVFVKGPDNRNTVRDSGPFGGDRVRTVRNLVPGAYLISIDTKGDIGVGAYPSRIPMQCTGGKTLNYRVEFK
jgi:hypothetical protein